MANIDMTLEAIDSETFEVDFEVELSQDIKEAIVAGIQDVISEYNIPPHFVVVTEINDRLKNTPLITYQLCAKGAARLAFGISKETATVPFSDVT